MSPMPTETILESPVGPRVRINARTYDYFCGTSYYCLHGDPRLVEAACQAAKRYGLGRATGTLTTPPLQEVRRRAATFFGADDAWYIVSGYLSDAFLLQALQEDYDRIFFDASSHYSILDAIALTSKPATSFSHRAPDDLARQLRSTLQPGERPLLMTDGVFPITGVIAPLREYWRALQEYERPVLCVDDAHALGVIGEHGRGSLEHCDIEGDSAYACGTLSKAFGGLGGIIPGSRGLMEKIQRHVRMGRGSSPVSNPAAAAAAMGLRILSEQPHLREKLHLNVFRLREGLNSLGLDVGSSPVPIISVNAREGLDLAALHRTLEENGIWVSHFPKGSYSDTGEGGMIRIAVFSTHTCDQIEKLLRVVQTSL